MKTFEVKTLGCKVNQYESQELREKLLALGFKESGGRGADIYIVNTCSVTHKADRESSHIVRDCNRLSPQARIFVTGCSAQNNPERLRAIGGVCGVIDNSRKGGLTDFVLSKVIPERNDGQSAVAGVGDLKEGTGKGGHISGFYKHTRAFLKIQDGCNNGCSYCIIPKLRGASRSRNLFEIVTEARGLALNGYKEIVLCGICLGAYGKDTGLRHGLTAVIRELEKIEGLLRIRLSSIEASDVSPELISAMSDSGKVCRHLHIPFQSGDDAVLRRMNRKSVSGDYRRLVLALRKSMPDIAITTDIMAGFPGESEEGFDNTVSFLREVQPLRVHVFSFSPRRNTAAFGYEKRINPEVIKERAGKIKDIAKELSADFRSSYIGRLLDVLFESERAGEKGLISGYSDNYIKVYTHHSQPLANQRVKVRVIRTFRDGLIAELPQLPNAESASLDTA